MKKPLIAASVFGGMSRCAILSERSKNNGAAIIEIRFDLCAREISSPGFCSKLAAVLHKKSSLTKIATFRIREEGGNPRFFDKQSEREDFYSAVFPYVDYVDVELAAADRNKVIALAKKARRKIIVSVHDLKKTLSDIELDAVLKKGFLAGGDMVKIACFANSAQDALRLLAFTSRNRTAKIITVSLGGEGVLTRVLAGVFGSRVLYGHAGKASFPHQLSVRQIADGLRAFDCR